jgi:hypothetical protein
MRVTTSLSFEIVTIRYLPPPASCAVPPLKDSLYLLVYQYLITLTGVVSGIVFFGERLGAGKILGGTVILLGVYLARWRQGLATTLVYNGRPASIARKPRSTRGVFRWLIPGTMSLRETMPQRSSTP